MEYGYNDSLNKTLRLFLSILHCWLKVSIKEIFSNEFFDEMWYYMESEKDSGFPTIPFFSNYVSEVNPCPSPSLCKLHILPVLWKKFEIIFFGGHFCSTLPIFKSEFFIFYFPTLPSFFNLWRFQIPEWIHCTDPDPICYSESMSVLLSTTLSRRPSHSKKVLTMRTSESKSCSNDVEEIGRQE